jgi:hypothetical protein
MNQFSFERGLRTLLLIMMGIGVVSLLITYLGDDSLAHARFWSNILHNSVFFTGMAILALFMLGAKITAWSGWHTVFKRIWEAFSLFLIPGIVLMLLIAAGVWGEWHHLYHWADAEAVASDPILQGKSSFLNPSWYTFGTLIIMGLYILVAIRIRRLSLAEDNAGDLSFRHHKRMRIWGAIALPLVGFGSAALIWQWVMSVDAHWYSTLFAWYNAASLLIAMVALTILVLFFMKARGYFRQVTMEHMHDLGKYLFAFSIFWTYLWFSQYMLIWYGNIGEETVYFKTRLDHYPVLFYGNLLINFALPFLVLMRNDTKRKIGTMVFTSVALLIGHWLDFFLMFKPGILHTAESHIAHADDVAHTAEHATTFTAGFTAPGFLEFGTMIGFLGLFLYFSFLVISRAALIPRNDPYLAESVHHHV